MKELMQELYRYPIDVGWKRKCMIQCPACSQSFKSKAEFSSHSRGDLANKLFKRRQHIHTGSLTVTGR